MLFYFTQYQIKRILNSTSKFTLTLSLISKRNMKKLSFLPKSLLFQSSRLLRNFEALSKWKRCEIDNNANCQQWVENLQFSRFSQKNKKKTKKTTNEIERRNSIFLFSCINNIKSSYQRQPFGQVWANEINRKCSFYLLVQYKIDLCFQWDTFSRRK